MHKQLILLNFADGGSEDEEVVTRGAEMFGFKTPKRRSTMTTPLKTPTSVSKQRVTKTPNKTPLKTPVRGRPRAGAEPKTPQTVRKRLRNSKSRHLTYD